MKRNISCASLLVLVAFLSTPSLGGIPVPSLVLYGHAIINCQPVTSEDDVTIVARVDGVPEPVGRYRMGARAPIGDYYALTIRLESGADGSAHGAHAARVGDTVQVSLQQDGEPELPVATLVIEQIGLVSRLDLRTGPGSCPGDVDDDGDWDLSDAAVCQRCFTGAGGALTPGCEPCDLDVDNDVDLDDWSGFQAAFIGPW